MHFKFKGFCEHILRVLDGARTTRATQNIVERAFVWDGPQLDPEEVGTLILDDYLQLTIETAMAERNAGATTSVLEALPCCAFLFKKRLFLCRCRKKKGRKKINPHNPLHDTLDAFASFAYPIQAWDIGPGLRMSSDLLLLATIPCSGMISVVDKYVDGKYILCNLEKEISLILSDCVFRCSVCDKVGIERRRRHTKNHNVSLHRLMPTKAMALKVDRLVSQRRAKCNIDL